MEMKLTKGKQSFIPKKVKDIIKEWVKYEYDILKYENKWNIPWEVLRRKTRLIYEMKDENITHRYNTVDDIIFSVNGVEVAKMERQYSTRKINLTYKQLKPKLIFLDAEGKTC